MPKNDLLKRANQLPVRSLTPGSWVPRVASQALGAAATAMTVGGSAADTLDGFHASATPGPNIILVLDGSGKVPAGAIPAGDGNVDAVDGFHASAIPTAGQLLALDGNAKIPVGALPSLDAPTVDGLHASATPTLGQLLALDANSRFPASTITLAATSGLSLGGGLNLADTIAGSGLGITNKVLAVNVGDGIDIVSDAVAVDVTDFIDTGYGLTENANDLRINLAATSGLQFSGGALQINDALAGNGLTISSKILAVGAGAGISVAADAVAIDTAANLTWTGAHIFQGAFKARDILPEAMDAYDLGSSVLMFRKGYLSELQAVLFAKSTNTLIGGWFTIPKNTGSLPAAINNSQTQINFGQAMTPNDYVVFRQPLKVEYMKVGTLVSGTTYNVTRNSYNGSQSAWEKDAVYMVLGQSGAGGRIELNATDTPRIQILKQGAAYNSGAEVVRIGDLRSWGDYAAAESYGIALGEYADTNKANLTWDATNGLRLRAGNVTMIQFDQSGNASIAGWLQMGASGGIYQGTGTFASPQIGLKLYNSGGKGVFEGWGSDGAGGYIKQFYLGTDGKAYAGGGRTTIDTNGVTLQLRSNESWQGTAAYNWSVFDGGYTIKGLWAGYGLNAIDFTISLEADHPTTDQNIIDICAHAPLENQMGGAKTSISAGGGSFAIVSCLYDPMTGAEVKIDAPRTVLHDVYPHLEMVHVNAGPVDNVAHGHIYQIASGMQTSFNARYVNSGGGVMQWWRDDIAAATSWVATTNAVPLMVRYAAAGVNPITFVDLLQVVPDTAGAGEVGNVLKLTAVQNLAANSSGVGAVKMKGGTSRDSSGFLKIYVGATAYYVPVWSAVTG